VRPDFTVAVMPDTQYYSSSLNGGSPAIFNKQTDWIVENREAKNIVFTIHLGDLVQVSQNIPEWVAAHEAMSRLENPITTKLTHGMPYSIAVGNHEMYGNYVQYNQYFGVDRFSGRPYYGGHFGSNNNNHYSYFSASGLDFIVLSLEFDAGSKAPVMAWANSVLANHAASRAIVISHSLLSPLDRGWNAEGLKIYNALKDNPNMFLMLCGHDPQTGNITQIHNGKRVDALLSDYSNMHNGGDGWMRLMTFSPTANRIQVDLFSPWLNEWYPFTGWHKFSLPFDMALEAQPFALVNTKVVNADGVTGVPWTDLAPGTTYEWYATLDHNGLLITTPTATFGTASDYANVSLIPRPLVYEIKPFSDPIPLEGVFQTSSGYPVILWRSKGGARYRVEYSNNPTTPTWTQIVRSESLETDPAPSGTDSFQMFVDDGSYTGGLSPGRIYQVREMTPVRPLEIIGITKSATEYPAIMWHSVGGKRYRVQYSDGNPMVFKDVVRPAGEETDPAPSGAASYRTFMDDGSYTGGPAPTRFYRVYEVP
jgi:hypothetical protein